VRQVFECGHHVERHAFRALEDAPCVQCVSREKTADELEDEWRTALTRTLLRQAVPGWLRKWREQGLTVDQARAEGLAGADIIPERADLMVRGAKGCGEVFNALAKAVAALSFHPGGVELFGARFVTDPSSWKAKHE
jgi:hypothetical protein